MVEIVQSAQQDAARAVDVAIDRYSSALDPTPATEAADYLARPTRCLRRVGFIDAKHRLAKSSSFPFETLGEAVVRPSQERAHRLLADRARCPRHHRAGLERRQKDDVEPL